MPITHSLFCMPMRSDQYGVRRDQRGYSSRCEVAERRRKTSTLSQPHNTYGCATGRTRCGGLSCPTRSLQKSHEAWYTRWGHCVSRANVPRPSHSRFRSPPDVSIRTVDRGASGRMDHVVDPGTDDGLVAHRKIGHNGHYNTDGDRDTIAASYLYRISSIDLCTVTYCYNNSENSANAQTTLNGSAETESTGRAERSSPL